MSRGPRRVVGAIALAGAFVSASPVMEPGGSQPPPLGMPWIDTTDRDAVIRAHETAFSLEIPPIGWTGGDDGCDPGSSNPAFRAATMERVNYYRAMAGVEASVAEEPAFSAKAQKTAMMMSAEGALTHSPGVDHACFTPIGQEGAANSNLYLGRNGPAAIDGYIEDPGADNVDVGHRNTILHPPTREMGVGDVERTAERYSANALWVFDQRVFDEDDPARRPPMREAERFVAWPPRGYVPGGLVHPRWSFTRSGVDMSEARVSVYDLSPGAGGARVPLQVVNRSGAPGHVPLPTLVWEPAIGPPAPVDRHFLVVVTRVAPEIPVLASTGEVRAEGRADPVPPERYGYVVRILGPRPSGQLDPGQVLARITASTPSVAVGSP